MYYCTVTSLRESTKLYESKRFIAVISTLFLVTMFMIQCDYYERNIFLVHLSHGKIDASNISFRILILSILLSKVYTFAHRSIILLFNLGEFGRIIRGLETKREFDLIAKLETVDPAFRTPTSRKN